MTETYRLIISCPDQSGIVAKVSQFIAQYGGWIAEANHHSDADKGWFFMRHEILADSLPFGVDEFKTAFGPIANELKMQWKLSLSSKPKQVALLASKEAHCLSDILYRWKSGELFCNISCIISNHPELEEYANWYKVPFYHIPVPKGDKDAAFQKVASVIKDSGANTLVLARYMQILPKWICDQYPQSIINIHHSSLPSFAGARPYHQAYQHGVKLVGATCHYVTEDLDEGPIIDQDVIRISHKDSLDDIIRLGRDVEKMVLARGLRQHLEDRVLVHDKKTVVFT